jgi:hypothetical protein
MNVTDRMQAYDASVDVGSHVLRLGQDEVPVREAPTASVLTGPGLPSATGTGCQYVGNVVALVVSRKSIHGGLPRRW